MKYTVSMATWYGGQWHLDLATESDKMNEQAIIKAGRELSEMGAMVLYTEYKDGFPNRVMIEFNGHLEPAFAEMIAPCKQTTEQIAAQKERYYNGVYSDLGLG